MTYLLGHSVTILLFLFWAPVAHGQTNFLLLCSPAINSGEYSVLELGTVDKHLKQNNHKYSLCVMLYNTNIFWKNKADIDKMYV
jgi:hypothetical protein